MKKTICVCDICSNLKNIEEKKLQIIFKNDDKNGTKNEYILSNNKIDICEKCFEKVLKGKAIWGKTIDKNDKFSFKKM